MAELGLLPWRTHVKTYDFVRAHVRGTPASSLSFHHRFAYAYTLVKRYSLKLEGGKAKGEIKCWIQPLIAEIGVAYATMCAGGRPKVLRAITSADICRD